MDCPLNPIKLAKYLYEFFRAELEIKNPNIMFYWVFGLAHTNELILWILIIAIQFCLHITFFKKKVDLININLYTMIRRLF